MRNATAGAVIFPLFGYLRLNLADKKTLLLGATGLIGNALARMLVAEGTELLLHYREENTLSQELLSVSSEACGLALDIKNTADCQQLIQKATEQLDGLDIIINTIGQFTYQPLDQLSPGTFRQIIDNNLLLNYDLLHYALPHLRASAGQVLLYGYASAEQVSAKPHILPYHIAKMGIVLLSQSLAVSEARHGIRINCLSPSTVTGAKHAIPGYQGQAASPVQLAQAAKFLLCAEYLSGCNLRVDANWRARQ